MNFFKQKIWPVLAGFIVASLVMFLFEFVNSFFFPLPQDLEWSSHADVQAFTNTLPWTAFILVLMGGVLGAFKGGCVTTYLAGENKYRHSFVLGIFLTLAALLNVFAIGHPMWFVILYVPAFIVFTYLGQRYLVYAHGKYASQNVMNTA